MLVGPTGPCSSIIVQKASNNFDVNFTKLRHVRRVSAGTDYFAGDESLPKRNGVFSRRSVCGRHLLLNRHVYIYNFSATSPDKYRMSDKIYSCRVNNMRSTGQKCFAYWVAAREHFVFAIIHP
jgi:hypothetical protein